MTKQEYEGLLRTVKHLRELGFYVLCGRGNVPFDPPAPEPQRHVIAELGEK